MNKNQIQTDEEIFESRHPEYDLRKSSDGKYENEVTEVLFKAFQYGLIMGRN